MNCIYTITVCEKCHLNSLGWPDFGDLRVVGWYSSYEKAELAVKENWADIFEYSYEYAFIEQIEEGLYPNVPSRWFFKWNEDTKQYEHIQEPEGFKHFANFSIG